MMKIVHMGGVPAAVGPIVAFQRAQGHSVIAHLPRSLGVLEGDPTGTPAVTKLLEEEPDLIHLHQLGGLVEPISPWGALQAAGVKLVLELGSPVLPEELDLASAHAQLLGSFSRILSSAPELASKLNRPKNFQWSAPGLPLESIPRIEPYQPEIHKVKVLHFALPGFEADTATIAASVEALKAKGLKFLFATVASDELPDIATLCLRLSECDLLIESTSQASFGLAGAYALACGKTVLGGNRSASRALWTQLETCPVMDVSAENLTQKLEAVLREPKSMRDLGKRGRAYAENYLDIRRTGALLYQSI
ncbi:MAG: hypothetical protein K1X83_02130 [Oligoflexia bacterium]|nr:hypothetical protein [Oligoflexia bacterium]